MSQKPLGEREEEMKSLVLKEAWEDHPPITLWDYYTAPEGGDSIPACNWADKPHRLIYDLVKFILDRVNT